MGRFFSSEGYVQRARGMSLVLQVFKYGGESEFLIMTVDNIMVENEVEIMKQHTNAYHNAMLSFKLSQRKPVGRCYWYTVKPVVLEAPNTQT